MLARWSIQFWFRHSLQFLSFYHLALLGLRLSLAFEADSFGDIFGFSIALFLLLKLINHLWDIIQMLNGFPGLLLPPLPFDQVQGAVGISFHPFSEDGLYFIHNFHLFTLFHQNDSIINQIQINIISAYKNHLTHSSNFNTLKILRGHSIVVGYIQIIRCPLQYIIEMEPEQNQNRERATKPTQCPINRQINRYRNSLPEVPREQGHFFFKETTRQMEEITYISIGYRIGNIPFQLQDMVAVIINNIHYSCEVNLKLIVDQDNLWVTGSIGISTEELNSLRFRIEQAHLNDSLLKTQRILAEFLQQIRNNPRREDTVVLEKLKKEIIKQIYLVYKNPDLED